MHIVLLLLLLVLLLVLLFKFGGEVPRVLPSCLVSRVPAPADGEGDGTVRMERAGEEEIKSTSDGILGESMRSALTE